MGDKQNVGKDYKTFDTSTDKDTSLAKSIKAFRLHHHHQPKPLDKSYPPSDAIR